MNRKTEIHKCITIAAEEIGLGSSSTVTDYNYNPDSEILHTEITSGNLISVVKNQLNI